MAVPRLGALSLAGVVLVLASCSGGGGGGGVIEPRISCGGSGAGGTNAVFLGCAGESDAVTEVVDVILSGPPSGSITLRGFNFDLTYEASHLELVPAGIYASPLLPDALVVVALHDGQQGRVVVSIQQPGSLPGVTAGPGPARILTLAFRRAPGASFSASPLRFENEEATGSAASIAFTSDLHLSYR